MIALNVLVACEESGRVRDAFNALGHNAWSCDLKPSRGRASNHLQGDVRHALDGNLFRFPDAIDMRTGRTPIVIKWDMMIAFPDCTYLTNSAAWAYGDGPYHQRVRPGTLVGAARRAAREEAVAFARLLLIEADHIPRRALENPGGVLSSRLRKADQIIHPYQFGDDASKATHLWLIGLPKLEADPADYVTPRMANGLPRWGNQTDSGQNRLSPSPDRAAIRAETYPGIAKAMAAQWSKQ